MSGCRKAYGFEGNPAPAVVELAIAVVVLKQLSGILAFMQQQDALRHPLDFFQILALLVLNGPVWFVDRFALHPRLSWLLLFASLLLSAGLYQLRHLGPPRWAAHGRRAVRFRAHLATGDQRHLPPDPPPLVCLATFAGLGGGLQATQWLESAPGAASQPGAEAHCQARRGRMPAAVWRCVWELYAAQQDVYSLGDIALFS